MKLGNDYTIPNTIDDLHVGNTPEDRGHTLEEFLYNYYETLEYDVLYSERFDFGIDLILIKDKTRIGVQAKNFYIETVSEKDIQPMLKATKIYGLDEMWLVTTSTLDNNAKQFANNFNIKVFERYEIFDMIKYLKNTTMENSTDDIIFNMHYYWYKKECYEYESQNYDNETKHIDVFIPKKDLYKFIRNCDICNNKLYIWENPTGDFWNDGFVEYFCDKCWDIIDPY